MDNPRVPVTPDAFPETGENSLAGIGRRFAARLIDGIVLLGPALVLLMPHFKVVGEKVEYHGPGWVLFLVSFIIPVVYESVLIAYRGQTIGKATMHIRVARLADGSMPTWAQATIRALLPLAIASIPFTLAPFLALLVYAAAVFHPLRQGWHDRAAATVVVNTQ